jgi:glycosyltransferase involved in cell wall biosynthesis
VVDSTLTVRGPDIRKLSYCHSIECLSPRIGKYVCQQMEIMESQVDIKTAPCSFTDLRRMSVDGVREIDILMIARFIPGKGYELLEKAESKINEYNIHLCGFGVRIPNVRDAKIYECKDSFATCRKAKIFLSLQEKENYPSQALLEAMASGCAIIATDVGDTRLLLDESCAVIIPSDPDALVEAITRLMSDEDRRAELGRAARVRVKEQNIDRYSEFFIRDILKI